MRASEGVENATPDCYRNRWAMGFVIVLLVLFVPAIVAGLAIGNSTSSLWRVVLGTLTGAIIGTVFGAWLGWEFIPFSLKGGPHGGALLGHLGKSLLTAVAGSYLGTIFGAWVSYRHVQGKPKAPSSDDNRTSTVVRNSRSSD